MRQSIVLIYFGCWSVRIFFDIYVMFFQLVADVSCRLYCAAFMITAIIGSCL